MNHIKRAMFALFIIATCVSMSHDLSARGGGYHGCGYHGGRWGGGWGGFGYPYWGWGYPGWWGFGYPYWGWGLGGLLTGALIASRPHRRHRIVYYREQPDVPQEYDIDESYEEGE